MAIVRSVAAVAAGLAFMVAAPLGTEVALHNTIMPDSSRPPAGPHLLLVAL